MTFLIASNISLSVISSKTVCPSPVQLFSNGGIVCETSSLKWSTKIVGLTLARGPFHTKMAEHEAIKKALKLLGETVSLLSNFPSVSSTAGENTKLAVHKPIINLGFFKVYYHWQFLR